MLHLLSIAFAVVLLNLPFGFWRAGVRKFSTAWFVAVHAPVPFVVGLRLLTDLGWRLGTVPVLVAAYFVGQFVGGRLRPRPAEDGGQHAGSRPERGAEEE